MGPPKGESHWRVQQKKLLADNSRLENENKGLLADVDRLDKVCRDKVDFKRVN